MQAEDRDAYVADDAAIAAALEQAKAPRKWAAGKAPEDALAAALAAAAVVDAATPHATCRNREQTRFISVSQACSGVWLDITPDGAFSTCIVDGSTKSPA